MRTVSEMMRTHFHFQTALNTSTTTADADTA